MENAVSWVSKFFSGAKTQDTDGPQSYSAIEIARQGQGKDRKAMFPRFLGSATDQLRGLRGGPDALARLRLRDAFTPAQPVADIHHMAGRKDVLQTLIRSLEDQRVHVVLYGERGIGKTSLLRVLAELAEDAQYVVRYSSCGETTDFTELMRSIIDSIPLLYHGGYEPSATEIEEGKSLASLLPQGALSANQISDVLSRLSGTRLLLILDEFDRSPRNGFRRAIAELIKNLSDRSIRVQLVIAGVAANLSELVEAIPSIRRNVLGLHVPVMNSDEIRELLSIGEEASGIKFDDLSVKLISSFSCGSPYLASLLGQLAGLTAIDRAEREVSAQDVASAVRVAVDEIEQRISETSVEKVRSAFLNDRGRPLARLARIAMLNGGRLDTTPKGPGDMAAEECARALRSAGEVDALLIPSEDGIPGRYQFVEEGLPTYIWMLVAKELVDQPGNASTKLPD